MAGGVFAATPVPEVVVPLGPAHGDIGTMFAVSRRGRWQTPLGESPVDGALADRLAAACALVEEDDGAHLREHSLEVQLPFIQFLRKDAAIVPICVSAASDYDALEALGRALAEDLRAGADRLLGRG